MENKVNFHIKLLTSKNVVLVQCDNYEPEVFSPQIVEGRITFLNIIPNRRCCQISKTNVMNFVKQELQQSTKSEHFRTISASEGLAITAPLANSTPTNVKQRHSCNSQLLSSKFNSHLSSSNSTLPTPEPVRKAAQPHCAMLFQNPVMLNVPKGIKISRICRNPVEGTIKIPNNGSGSTHNSTNASVLDGNFNLPCSSVSSALFSNENISKHVFHSTPVDCIARWEKVLTPVRTYARKTKKPAKRSISKTLSDTSNITPTYLHNPTQGLNVSREIEIRKCKLIKDRKISISPRSFKKQQNQSLDAHTIKSNLSIHPHSLSFHKPRSYLETMGMSAFDLLTNSNRSRLINRKLNEQFRKGCINKASSTYFKYKVLSAVPSIQRDEQVLELSRITLEASQTKSTQLI